jgi:hypothetical protein
MLFTPPAAADVKIAFIDPLSAAGSIAAGRTRC